MKLNLTLRQALELTLALGGLVWIAWLAGPALNPKPGAGNLHIYALEAIVLSMAVVGGLLLQFPHGKPHLRMLWFCLGMGAALAALATMYFEIVALLSVAPAWAAAVMATVRVQGNFDRLLRWFWSGGAAQVVLIVVLLVGHAMTRRMAGPFPGDL